MGPRLHGEQRWHRKSGRTDALSESMVLLSTADSGSFVVTPDLGLLAWSFLLLLVPGLVTLAKGRTGWFLVGLVTGGVLWVATSLLLATPDSVWGRAFYGPEKMQRARRRFPRRLPFADPGT